MNEDVYMIRDMVPKKREGCVDLINDIERRFAVLINNTLDSHLDSNRLVICGVHTTLDIYMVEVRE